MNAIPNTLFSDGMQALEEGDYAAAKGHFKELLRLSPETPEALSGLGFAVANLGEVEAALSHTAKATAAAPGNPQIRVHRAFALKQGGKPEAAAEELIEANRLAPGQPPILNQLTKILQGLEKDAKAEPYIRKLVQLQPRNPVAANRYINCLIAQEKGKEALKVARAISGRFPDNHFIWGVMGSAAKAAMDWLCALPYYEKLVQHDPADISSKRGLALTLMELNRFEEALPVLKEIYDLDPSSKTIFYSFGYVYFNLRRYEESKLFIEKMLAENPDHLDALILKGRTLVFHGELEDAKNCFERALALDPVHPMAHMQLTKMDPPTERTETFDLFETLRDTLADDDPHRAMIGFTLGEMYDSIGEYDKAFENFALSNERVKEAHSGIGAVFDEAETVKKCQHLKQLFSEHNFAGIDFQGSHSKKPIFIVAMPRSGTTLLEQIISSHSRVLGAGELSFASKMAKTFFEDLPADTLEGLQKTLKDRGGGYAQGYLSSLPATPPGVDHVSDKMPSNFLHLGLLQLVLPNATYLHIRRNPLDSCLSMYKGFFNKNFHYSFDLYNLGFYYRQYYQLMAHWRKVLPRPMLEICYEDLVTNSETRAPEILRFCGLAWEDGCLEYYKNKNKVITMSTYQVRKPINTSAIDKWRRYEKHLGPLLEGLGEDIVSTLKL